jgi:septum formation protein
VEKAETAARAYPEALILAADTVVACGRRVLPKAETEGEARSCLELLAGRRHRVYGGIALRAPGGRLWQKNVMTMVKFARLADADIAAYLASGDWKGKAGGYAIQGAAGAFVSAINGSYTNVVGLCIHTVARLLDAACQARD